MIQGEKIVDQPIRWAMIGGGRGSQIGYIHRSAALRDNNFKLVAGAFDIDAERGRDFGMMCHDVLKYQWDVTIHGEKGDPSGYSGTSG